MSNTGGNSGALLAKQRSFDVAESREGGTYGFSGHENRSTSRQKNQSQQPLPTPLSRSYSFMQRREKYNQYQDEDDSMHEKYFLGTSGTGGGGTGKNELWICETEMRAWTFDNSQVMQG